MATFNLGSINQFGERFGLRLLDPLAAGSGGFAGHDGISAGGPVAVPVPSIADVEANEQVSPLFYLHRRLRPATGEPGPARRAQRGIALLRPPDSVLSDILAGLLTAAGARGLYGVIAAQITSWSRPLHREKASAG